MSIVHIVRFVLQITINHRSLGATTIKLVIGIDNSSKWWIESHGKIKQCTMKEINTLVQGSDIDTNNLCQLLAQDRVVELSRMSAPDLLVETERSICNGALYTKHDKLIKLRQEHSELMQVRSPVVVFVRRRALILSFLIMLQSTANRETRLKELRALQVEGARHIEHEERRTKLERQVQLYFFIAAFVCYVF
jgi:hypothetical protein